MFFSVLTLSVLLAFCFGGDLRRLVSLDIRRFSWILCSLVIRAVAEGVTLTGPTPPVWRSAAVALACYGTLFYGLSANLRVPGIWLVAVGTGANFTAIALNGFRMPVSLKAFDATTQAQQAARLAGSITHRVLDASTQAPFLADILTWNYFTGRPSMISIGDVLIALGAGWLVFRASKPRFSARPPVIQ